MKQSSGEISREDANACVQMKCELKKRSVAPNDDTE